VRAGVIRSAMPQRGEHRRQQFRRSMPAISCYPAHAKVLPLAHCYSVSAIRRKNRQPWRGEVYLSHFRGGSQSVSPLPNNWKGVPGSDASKPRRPCPSRTVRHIDPGRKKHQL
jgi:hypothetical protein